MPGTVLEFEKPILELVEKISELKNFSSQTGIDLVSEIDILDKKARELKKSIYGNLTPWQTVLLARHPNRPNALEYINMIIDDYIELHGDRCYGDDPAITGGIGYFCGYPVTAVGILKGRETKENLARNFGMPHPEGYRKAMRLIRQAEKFGRPVICFIDTPGAYCGMGAEERGQSEAIASSLVLLSKIKVPVVSIVIGEGGSGGALALAAGDRILMQQHAVFSIISPESYAIILWKESSRAKDAAEIMKITARDVYELGIADEIIAEPLGGAHSAGEEAAALLKEAVSRHLQHLRELPAEELLSARFSKIRKIGSAAIGQQPNIN
ncbi:acetyl-CoA carboxylase, carboxyl transferase, alpha subunit [Desulfofarcimen acetoxidans DSM 771]|uniref:Acetyl-coenzyme A carboxylase carboxyl transferase subunit alpha n=1 Tax=Desulfofarcimen acetoxidans (strain ATCC 49208 / DSM 771 / KCTC 5769 / VKM B-1644 / 5575) TaxID=485916 RepID=C8W257_DESAS|nr:acetyl-CoA carboxylase carboxyltransferase subunit alpha [Desulfofarcimen acetoxidans]ACV61721.1 acetyl-CoA carboxylase, carboxyl transferase, alpha subunit [Desulfofarcimen acetoxidans DSM 771]